MRTNHRACVLALGLAVVASSAGLAAGHEAALGADGEVYAVRAGTYGELFPNGKEFDRANRVVALDVTAPGGPLQRLLVPGTGDPAIESSPSVLFEDDSHTVFLLWESEKGLHPVLRLAGFDGSAWSNPIEVIGNPLTPKTSPQFAITRDTYNVLGPDHSPLPRHRTLLHLVWQEENSAGTLATLYSPIVINDGEYIGRNPIYSLDDYLQGRLDKSDSDVQTSLAHTVVVENGSDERTIVIAFASAIVGRFAVIEVDVLPEQLTQLADKARMHIVDLGHDLYPSDLANLAEKARMHIVDLGRAFRPEVVEAIGDQIKAQILAGGTDGLESLSEKARMHIVDLGSQLSGRGLRGVRGADATAKILEIESVSNLPDPSGNSGSFFLKFRIVSNLPVPHVGPGSVRLFVSETGENVIVSWAQLDKVLYRNNREDGWGDPRELRFSANLNLAKAYEILRQRLSNR